MDFHRSRCSRIVTLVTFCCSILETQSSDKMEAVTHPHGTIRLPCDFPFIKGSAGLTVVWEKVEDNGRRVMVHKFKEGDDFLMEQDLLYIGRTELSREFSQGDLTLTLHRVTPGDQGRYYCRAANMRGHGDKEVELTIQDETKVTAHLKGTVRLPCHFPFIRGSDSDGLIVVWKKKEDNDEQLLVHKFLDGRDNLSHQHKQYTRRTGLDMRLDRGDVDLILREVVAGDEGTYHCTAKNARGFGDKKVRLSRDDGAPSHLRHSAENSASWHTARDSILALLTSTLIRNTMLP